MAAASIHAIADQLQPRLRAQFLAAVKKLQSRMSIDDIAAAVARGGITVQLDAAMRAWPDDLRGAVATINRVFEETAQATEAEFARRFKLNARFDLVNPRALDAALLGGQKFAADITAGVRTSINQIIRRAIDTGIPPREAARLIRPLVGLTDRQAMAVINYRLSLLQAGASPTKVLKSAQDYSARLHRQRALNIARTETINAGAAGRHATWREAQAKGYLPPTQTKKWVVTFDDRLCPLCLQMAGQEVLIHEAFKTPDGRSIDGPTLHPSCRCVTVLVIKRRA